MNKYGSYKDLKEIVFSLAYSYQHATQLPYKVEGADHAYKAIEWILIMADLEKEFHDYVKMRGEAGHSAYAKYIEEKNSKENKNENENE